MSDLEAQRELFLMFCMGLMVAAPIVSWLVLPNRDQRSAQLWFAGAGTLGLVAIIYFLERRGSTAVVVLNITAGLLALTALRHERHPGAPTRLGLLAGLTLSLAVAHEGMELAVDSGRLSGSVLLAVRVALLVALEWAVVVQALALARRHRSRGMRLTAIGTLPLALLNSARLVGVMVGAPGMGPEIGSTAFPYLAATLTFTSLTYSFGYVAYSLERNWQHLTHSMEALARSEERESVARAFSSRLQALIDERDEMLMNSSRLSAVRAMGLYNASIVHEISQPLQALRSVLDNVQVMDRHQPQATDRRRRIGEAQELLAKVSHTVQSLRRLMSAQPLSVHPTPLNDCVRAVLPVIENEARRRGIALKADLDAQLESRRVSIDPVLLQRLLMNLAGNSLDAMRGQSTPRTIQVSSALVMEGGSFMALLAVTDSGPGFPPQLISARGLTLSTQKTDGMGIGLTLARLLMVEWKGELRLKNIEATEHLASKSLEEITPAPPLGARVELLLRLA